MKGFEFYLIIETADFTAKMLYQQTWENALMGRSYDAK